MFGKIWDTSNMTTMNILEFLNAFYYAPPPRYVYTSAAFGKVACSIVGFAFSHSHMSLIIIFNTSIPVSLFL